jgi:hypothetical protein
MKLNVSAAPCMALLSKKHRKPIFKENIQKSKKERKNQKIVFYFFTTSNSLNLVLSLSITH